MRKIVITPDMKRQAQTLAGFGLSDAQIGTALAMSESTLRRRLRGELDRGRVDAAASVAKSLYKLAAEGNVTACIWLEKTRSGRSERAAVEVTGAEGAPMNPSHGVLIVPAPIDPQAWEQAVAHQQRTLCRAEQANSEASQSEAAAEPAAPRRPKRAPPPEPLPEPVAPLSVAPLAGSPAFGTAGVRRGWAVQEDMNT